MSRAGSPPVERGAAEWLERLPWPDLDGEGRELPGGVAPPWEQAVQVRVAGEETILRQAGAYLGRVEVFGPKQSGRLRLEAGRLGFTGARGSWQWPLHEVTAVQPASSSIQLKATGRPVVSLRFPIGSVRLWEQRIKYGVRLAWREAGRGEITEFQPRIRAR